jgi:myo-inositol-1-phosphate synthase
MNIELGGYHVGDIEIARPSTSAPPRSGRTWPRRCFRAEQHAALFRRAGIGHHRPARPHARRPRQIHAEEIDESDAPEADVTGALERSRTDVLVSYLPVGSQQATEFYAERALEAGCAFVNCIPVFIASNPDWRKRFEERGVPIIGDDIKSQVGATIVHRVLANLFRERGVRLDRTYQLNFGGNTDFQNMLERERLESKKISKTQSVTSQLDIPLSPENIHVGPSDFVPWLSDRKWAYIRMEGTTFGGVPLNVELKLEVWDSPNSAGVVIDAVRCAKLAQDRGIGGALVGPSSYFMKSPPEQFTDSEARERTLRFVAGDEF